MASELSGKTISIRQTRDPFIPDIQYIAFTKATLYEWGRLNLRNLGIGTPGGNFRAILWLEGHYPPTGRGTWGTMDGFLPDFALEQCFSVDEDGWSVITVVEYKDFRRAEQRDYLMRVEESRQRRIKYWSDLRKTILAPVAWIFPDTESRTERGIYEELPSNDSKNDSSLAVVSKSPIDLHQRIGVRGLNNESRARLPTWRLVVDKVDKMDAEELQAGVVWQVI